MPHKLSKTERKISAVEEADRLVRAILRDIEWRENVMRLKEEKKIKRMLLRLRQNGKTRTAD